MPVIYIYTYKWHRNNYCMSPAENYIYPPQDDCRRIFHSQILSVFRHRHSMLFWRSQYKAGSTVLRSHTIINEYCLVPPTAPAFVSSQAYSGLEFMMSYFT